ncbi:hypothetical protein [Enterococcus dongliensis]|uniref:hypothetical protein n=1 Tax=Enterococcus dongliensis TaxID=2559925 RepID=UPI00289ADF77|nr:hypothetical protein [Enterococcus dongliensis]
MPSNINHVSKVDRAKVGRARLVSYVPDRYEFVPLGTFYISGRVDPDRNEKTTTVEARDGFIFMEDKYESELKYPTKLADIALEIANKSGSIIDPVSFNHLSNYTINKFEGYTYRQAIGLIGQFEGGFVCFDREGRLSIRKLADPNFKIEPNEYFLKGLVKSELLYQPRGITCKVVNQTDESSNETVILQSGSTSGAQISLENNVMTQILLDDTFQKIRYINFYPITLKWRGNPALEVGDWVTMTDREGNRFKSPVLNYAMSFDGGFSSTISADTKAYSANVSSFKGPLQQKLDDIDYRIDAAGKNNVYEGTEEPKNPKEGDIWFKKNGPDDEIWVYKQTSPGVFEWVMTTSTALEESIKEQIENSTPKDEIVKTINLSDEMDGTEWLKIKGAKLWLTNETKIDKAVITSAMIGSVDAGTISVGTLDASKIRVTNLDASAISTGTLDASKIRVTNLDASAITARTLKAITIQGVNITGSKIVTDGAEFRMTQDNGKLTWFSKEHNKDFMSLEASKFTGADVGIVKYKMGVGGGFQLRDSKDNLVISSYDNGAENQTWLSFSSDSLFWSNRAFVPDANYSYINASGVSIVIQANSYSYSFANGNITTSQIKLMGYQTSIINSGLRVYNGLSVSGTKNSLVNTQSYGERLLNAYETPEYLFATYGKVTTDSNGHGQVIIEEKFLETINTKSDNYHVFLSPYEKSIVYAENLRGDSFSVKSDRPYVTMSYQLVAYRLGYEDFYLETPRSNKEKHPNLPTKILSSEEATETISPIIPYPEDDSDQLKSYLDNK